ncbi:MAG: NAD(+) diphosphatase [Saprospiraceae bacterium]
MENAFQKLTLPPKGTENDRAYWFIYQKRDIVLYIWDHKMHIPRADHFPDINGKPLHQFYLGKLHDMNCYAVEIADETRLPEDFKAVNLRLLYDQLGDDIFFTAGYGYQMIHWNRTSKYCGRCGHENALQKNETAKKCPNCSLVLYPRISPAVIMSVIKDDKILLAHNARGKRGFYSVLAGFVEPGETLEDCVRREIKEEVNLEVKNIRYFGSQPWPFPDSLMIGFISEYASGEVILEEEELDDYGWFTKDNLPEIPSKISISRALIDDWIKGEG